MTADAATSRRMLGPVRSHTRWTVSGLAAQAVGLGGVTAFLWAKLRHQGISGHITAAMFRLVWHGEVHTRTGLVVLIAGTIIYAAGSVLLARPYVSRPVTLFIAVPVAAVVGMVVLGVLAWFAASLVGALGDLLTPDFDFGDRRKKARARRQ